MEVRRVRPEEHEEAGRITSGAYREYVPPDDDGDWEDYLGEIADVAGRDSISSVFVAVVDDRIIGTATVEYDHEISKGEPPMRPDEARLRMLGVDPGARTKGAGQALLDAAMEDARRNGRVRMILNTTDRMVAAQRLYERNGFVRGEDFSFPSGFCMRSYARDL